MFEFLNGPRKQFVFLLFYYPNLKMSDSIQQYTFFIEWPKFCDAACALQLSSINPWLTPPVSSLLCPFSLHFLLQSSLSVLTNLLSFPLYINLCLPVPVLFSSSIQTSCSSSSAFFPALVWNWFVSDLRPMKGPWTVSALTLHYSTINGCSLCVTLIMARVCVETI